MLAFQRLTQRWKLSSANGEKLFLGSRLTGEPGVMVGRIRRDGSVSRLAESRAVSGIWLSRSDLVLSLR